MDLGSLSHLLEKYELFIKLSKWVIFEQKAWAIAHGFDEFWVIFTPFGKCLSISASMIEPFYKMNMVLIQ